MSPTCACRSSEEAPTKCVDDDDAEDKLHQGIERCHIGSEDTDPDDNGRNRLAPIPLGPRTGATSAEARQMLAVPGEAITSRALFGEQEGSNLERRDEYDRLCPNWRRPLVADRARVGTILPRTRPTRRRQLGSRIVSSRVPFLTLPVLPNRKGASPEGYMPSPTGTANNAAALRAGGSQCRKPSGWAAVSARFHRDRVSSETPIPWWELILGRHTTPFCWCFFA